MRCFSGRACLSHSACNTTGVVCAVFLIIEQEVEQLRMSVARLVAERSVATERLQSLEQELAAVRASTSPIQDATGR